MPKKAKELGPLEVRRLEKPGRYAVGGASGMLLQVSATGGCYVLKSGANAET